MRRAAIVILAVMAAAASAAGQTPPAPAPATPAQPVQGLGGQNLSSSALTSPFQRPPLAGLSASSLNGLPAVGDPAPQCRVQCARQRYACDGDDGDCAQTWRQCAEACEPGRDLRGGF